MKRSAAKTKIEINITAPNYQVLTTAIVGTAPYVSNNFSGEHREQMVASMEEGQAGKAGKKIRPPKDFDAAYRGSLHQAVEGWYGIPATAIRASLVRACCLTGMEMTKAKMTVFVIADGYEKDGTPLIKISKGKPERFDAPVRNTNGSMDIRARGRFAPGWECTIRIRYDADLIKAEHVANLINRAGTGVGIGAGRPFSSQSCGMGWGTFEIRDKRVETKVGSKTNGKKADKHAETLLS